MPAPLTPAPVPASPLVDARMEFGKPRCYVVRAVTMYGTQAVEGEASPPACVMPADTFAPAAPASLKAVGSEGAVSLVWDAGKEADLAGYLVMRAAIPGGEFAPVTREPVKEATFTDMTAGRGVRYAYVVVAVDTAGNRSLKSNQVEEAAR
jgi:fibronectin type 3 domain-containing protein